MAARDSGSESSIVALANSALAEPALARSALDLGLAALAAQDTETALRWLERALRLLPQDANTKLTLATACLRGNPSRAAALFADVAERHNVRQAWLGLAAARLRLGEHAPAAEALGLVLSRHVFVAETAGLAGQIGGISGWCGLRSDGGLEIHPTTLGKVQVALDGQSIRGGRLPPGWAAGRTLEVRRAGTHLLGSPIRIAAIRHLAGCVEARDGGLSGWAWHPADPDTAPVLYLTYADGTTQTLVGRDDAIVTDHAGPLARPRGFRLARDELKGGAGLIHVRGPDGADMPGSPLDPFADAASHVAASLRISRRYPASSVRRTPDEALHDPALRADAPVPPQPIGMDARRRSVTVVIPVHNGGPVVLACLTSVVASTPRDVRILVIDDGSTDPATIAALDRLFRQRKINLLRHSRTQGFPISANTGIRTANGRDVVLLNSDTLVPAGWLERLRDAAHGAADIGTVTPLSNDASILSYPGPAGGNPQPDQAATDRLDRLASRANGAAVTDIPVGVGFCLYLRRDCLNAVGLFREDVFAQGYGEENDLCLRARRLGWRNVALTGLFVGHLAGASFGSTANALRQRNGRLVEQLHPGHQSLIEAFLAVDPLAEARRRIDLLDWRQRGRAWRQAVILITHDEGGGVERRLALSARAHADAGRRPILLRPGETAGGEAAIAVRDGMTDDLPNLLFAMPQQLPALVRLLRAAKADRIEAHHLAGYGSEIFDLVAQLGLPYDVHVHDYAWFCPRVSLVAGHGRYCGEPDLKDCEACVADNGSFLKEGIGVAALRSRSAGFFAEARRVVVPADDVGVRMRRHFSTLSPLVVPHEDDDSPIPRPVTPGRSGGRAKVCVVGAIGVHKGYDVLLACARDAERRDLDLEFVVVGHTIDDNRMMRTGRVFVTGAFKPDEAVGLIKAQCAGFGFVPSICPETWCLGLGDLWRAGLQVAAFDIGAPAERIRRTQRGFVLPLGLHANAINNRLVAAIRTVRHL
jgi:GT2 family glycosyltransferase